MKIFNSNPTNTKQSCVDCRAHCVHTLYWPGTGRTCVCGCALMCIIRFIHTKSILKISTKESFCIAPSSTIQSNPYPQSTHKRDELNSRFLHTHIHVDSLKS